MVHAKHRKWSSADSGLILSQEHPYLATSPDLLTECDCLKNQVPTAQNVPYLEEVDGKVHLKRTRQYYGQIQGQLALTGRSFCDLFMYTEHGHLIAPVVFGGVFWEKLLTNLVVLAQQHCAKADQPERYT